MRRVSDDAALTVETVPVRGLDASALLALTFDGRGRIVDVATKPQPPATETAEERAARELAEGVAGRLRHIGSVTEALRRARMAVDLLENLAALEEQLGPDAIDMLGAGRAAP
jgi:hypothetical protein